MRRNLKNLRERKDLSIAHKVLLGFFVVSIFAGVLVLVVVYVYSKELLNYHLVAPIVAESYLNSLLRVGAGTTFVASMFAIVISSLLARSIVKPLTKLKEGAREIRKGNFDYKISIERKDEAGELAQAFNEMAEDVKKHKEKSEKYSEELEHVVAQKTNELKTALAKMNTDKKELEGQRSAILNILEDVQDSQESLEKSKKDLENRHYQLEILKSLSDKLTYVYEVSEAAQEVYNHLRKITDADVITLLISNPFDDGDLFFKSYLNKSVSEDYLDSLKSDIIEYSKKNSLDLTSSKEKILENICPSIEGVDLDNDAKTKPLKASVIPLSTSESYYGLVHLSYSETDEERSELENSLVKAIAATLSVTIDRLQILDRSQHSKTESLVRSLSDGVIMFSKDKNIVLTNSRATVYTGLFYTASTLDDFINLFPGIKIKEMIDSAIDKGAISHINEVLLINKFYEISVTPVKDSEEEIVGGSIIIHDITYMKEIDKMKTEFVSVASHQLRTPLTAIKLFTEVLVKEDLGKINKDQKEYLENIYKSTGRMVRLVNDLLNVTRIESGKLRISPVETDINDFIKNLIIEAEPSANIKGVSIKFKKIKIPKVKVDQNLFRQVVQNFISNAIRYSKTGGQVGISLSKDDFYYYIKVKDDGIGIPEEMQDRIFEKFYRADNAIKAVTAGTGLGLYTSKMIVEISGGKTWFKSVENKGTTFYVKMPLEGMTKKEGERGMMIS